MTATNYSVKILLIEDNEAEARLFREFLHPVRSQDFSLVHVTRLKEALQKLSQGKYDLILLDLTLPDSQGLLSLDTLFSLVPWIPIVVLTNTNDEELAIEAVQQGAQDYLVKRLVNTDTLVRSLQYAMVRKQVLESLRTINQTLENQVEERNAELVKAKEVNLVKSEFFSMLSHDIRNLLNNILLAAGVLQNNDEKLTKEKKITHLQMISSTIRSVAQLLDEVVFISRTDVDKLQCKLISMDLEAFCQQMVEEAQLAASLKELNLVFVRFGTLEASLWDKGLLRHICSNLLNNAIKYSLPGGTVRIELIGEENSVTLRFQDWGIGIAKEDQELLFQPFQRGENVDSIPGTGLGLVIVKKCVEAHGGEISVTSEVGIGTIFTVTLPVVKVG